MTKLFKRSGKLHVTVGYIPTTSTDDSIINVSSDTPTKYCLLYTSGLGSRPTVNDDATKVTCETFIPGFSGDLYGTDPVVEFYACLLYTS